MPWYFWTAVLVPPLVVAGVATALTVLRAIASAISAGVMPEADRVQAAVSRSRAVRR